MRGKRPSEGGPDPFWSAIGLIPAFLFLWFVGMGLLALVRGIFHRP